VKNEQWYEREAGENAEIAILKFEFPVDTDQIPFIHYKVDDGDDNRRGMKLMLEKVENKWTLVPYVATKCGVYKRVNSK